MSARWLTATALAAVAWWLAYTHLAGFSDAVVRLAGVDPATHLGAALGFFVYESPKVILLLAGIVFLMGIIHTFVSPERTRALLKKINDRLSHYAKLARFMGIPFHIKHAAARNEIDQVLHHLSHHPFQLMIIGGRRLSILSRLLRRKPIERLLHETPINTIAFYDRDHG